MVDIDLPSYAAKLHCDMSIDSGKISPELTANGGAFCCLCGRLLDFNKFSIEHIVPQQFLEKDKESIREKYKKNERTPIILLCKERLVVNQKKYLGCNAFKGSLYDKHITNF